MQHHNNTRQVVKLSVVTGSRINWTTTFYEAINSSVLVVAQTVWLPITLYEPVHEKTNNLGSDRVRHKPGCTVTEAGNFGFRKKRNYCTIGVAKTKALISFAVTAKPICAFVFAYADRWFSHVVAHIILSHDGDVASICAVTKLVASKDI